MKPEKLRYLFILNPWAGRGTGAKVIQRVMQAATAQGLDYRVTLTARPRHAMELAHEAADGYDVVVAVGGDGTVHEVVNGLLAASSGEVTRPLGIVPIGSGDDFANHLRLPAHSIEKCVARIAQGEPRRVDIGRVNGEYFANEVGLAFEAYVTAESRKVTAPVGPLIYLIAIFRSLGSYSLPRLRLRWEGGEVEREMLMVSVANGHRAGGGMLFAPDADARDGLFDVVMADAMGRGEILRLLPKVYQGKHISEEPVTVVRTPWLTVDSNKPLPVQADGEILALDMRHLEFELLPLRVPVLG